MSSSAESFISIWGVDHLSRNFISAASVGLHTCALSHSKLEEQVLRSEHTALKYRLHQTMIDKNLIFILLI